MTLRFWKVALVLAVLVGLTALTAHSASAAFGCYGDMEKFEGSFPPTGWSTDCTNDYGSSYGCWAKGTTGPSYGCTGCSGSDVETVYGDYYLDTTLYAPAFSTVNMRTAAVEFDEMFDLYSYYGNNVDLDNSVNNGSTWTNVANWNAYTNQHESKTCRRARWRRATSGCAGTDRRTRTRTTTRSWTTWRWCARCHRPRSTPSR